MAGSLAFAVPGDISSRTGGYEYDRRMMTALAERGWRVSLIPLDGSFPRPTDGARKQALRALLAEPVGLMAVVDGLALGAMAHEAPIVAAHLRVIGLVHHPLALETGISEADAVRFRDSEHRALSVVRHVVVTSHATAALLGDFGVEPSRVSVVEPGTDASPLARGSACDEIRLLAVGAVAARKGYAVLVKALSDIQDLPWRLVCVGSRERDAASVASVDAAVLGAGLAGRVEFAGELAADALAREYDRADLFVMPSLYEGYGMAVAEALARGLPVVASETGGIGVLVGTNAGRLCPPGDPTALSAALRELISDPQARAACAAGARGVRQRLPSWSDAARQMEAVLLRVGAS